ncbi:MAG: restriction endonuclease subunit S [Candidatus Dojkabacteria bacterium]|nr:restriction endonuclease subunit S [Candidatus Dojkabacteria bacterium]
MSCRYSHTAVLGDVADYVSEKVEIENIKLKDYVSTENLLPNIGGVDLADSLPNISKVTKFNKRDILISNIRPYFKKIWLANSSGGCSNDVLVLRTNDKIDEVYLYYNLACDKFFDYVMSGAKGTKMPRGDKKHILNFSIRLPSLDEQKAIAHILSTLDEKIEINNQINKKLEEMAQAIFKHWFVDFEFPNEDGEPYKSSGGEMVESELGMIPKGWKISGLDEIADYLNGLAMQKFRPKENEKSYPVLKIKELRQGFTDSSSDICSANIDKKYIIHDADIIFSWSGSLLVDIWCGGVCGLNQHLFKVTSNDFEKWFYYHWTKYHLDRFIGIAEGKATTMGHIKRKDLSDSKVLIPNKHIYTNASKLFKPIYDKIIESKIESRRLIALRDTLLPKLMSGEIRVTLDNQEL